MAFQPAPYSTRAVSVALMVAFAGIALWVFLPWRSVTTPTPGGAAPSPSLEVDGKVEVTANDAGVVTRVIVPLRVHGHDGIRLTEDGRMRAETFMSESAAAAVPAAYSVVWLDGNGDETLDPGEHAVLTASLPERTSVYAGNPMTLVIRPTEGPSLVIKNVLPQ